MRQNLTTLLTAALLAGSASFGLSAQVTLNFDAARRGPMISPLQYGIFYEEINNAGDGGLYAELIRNRCFEDASTPDYWSAVGDASMSITRSGLMNENRRAALQLKLSGADAGISNTGYWGIPVHSGEKFKLSVWLKSDNGYKGTLTASISEENSPAATGSAEIELDGKWKKITLDVNAPETARYVGKGKFNLTFSHSGSLTVGMVSLFPKTYNDRENGCREDLAMMLEGLKPKFVRFPGGCYIEGDGTLEGQRRFEWKKTIGPIEERPGHFNANWGYPSTDGLGFHEFLQLTEDLGAEPLFVVNVGIGHGWIKDYTDIDEYIQEALDALEYCNGDVTTFWGAKRAENGHPEPFNMRLLEIGNENYNFDDDRSDHYPERYKAFYDAIKAKYPEVTLIGNVEAWGTDNPSWRNSFPVEIVDEHYYRTPKWFEQRYCKYDSYDRSGPKVYVGEYAVTDGFGTNGHLRAALGEAVYMQGLENNSDICVMASYAPIFYHEERGGGWLPDMIRFNHESCFGTPSYYVQQLMPSYLGKQNVKWTEAGNIVNGGENKIGLSSWSTTVTYDNIRVTDLEGNVLLQEDFSGEAPEWDLPSSNWSIKDGQLTQQSGSEQGRIAFCNTVLPSSYVLELDATKKSGAEGFLVAVNLADRDNYIWWNIGGWNNGQNGLQVCANGAKSDYDLKSGNIETGRTYRVRMEVEGTRIKCYLDGELIHDLTLPSERKIYVSSSIDDDKQVMYVKLVNTREESTEVKLTMANAVMERVSIEQLGGLEATAENSMDNPRNVFPTGLDCGIAEDNTLTYSAPGNSLSIITISLSDINYEPATHKKATAEQMQTLEKELESIARKLKWLHQSTPLPVMTPSGTELKWEIATDGGGMFRYRLTSNRHSAQLMIKEPNTSDKVIEADPIGAYAKFPDGAEGYIICPVSLAPADEWYGYLYTYMNSGKEITNMALGSKEGMGKRFDQLLDGEEIFNTAELASIEGGTRDAYLGRGQKQHEYLMTTTDMCNAKSGKWNNYGMDLLRSNDLVHWESSVFDFRKGKSIFSDSDATTDCYKSDEEYAKIDRVWAPQFIWDSAANNGEGAYLIYYSLLSGNEWDHYDRLYYSYADKDFKTLTQPRLLMDPGVSLIDADIVFNEYDGLYHMLVKRTGTGAATTGIYEYTSPSLTESDWTEIGRMDNMDTSGIEAPTQIRRIGEDVYNMYFMCFDTKDYSYKVADMDHDGLKTGLPVKMAGTGAFQHGSVIYVDKDEFDMLQLYSDVKGLLRQAKAAMESGTTASFNEAIEFTEKVIADNRTVSALLENLPAAYDMLVEATGKYLAEGERLDNGYIDITRLLQNPKFDKDSSSGWSGTPFTAVSNNVAEHFSRVFDTYQVLKAMPAGSYRLEAQAFYRYGLPAVAQPAHKDGSEEILASLYINDSTAPVMSLYDEEYSNYPNNMYGASVAFNNDHKYNGNAVELIMPEAGDIRAGIRKLDMVDGDWTIFDNFRLYYKPELTSVSEIGINPETIVNVYSTDGTVVKSNVNAAEAVIGLDKGIYLIGNRKVVVK
ncbi:MAG: carbohydrate binding domain-containing protein [Muribaculaceae bacterium]|nr:carbohydrate binding domain-containing protein [Muribaculaceae bacterium]